MKATTMGAILAVAVLTSGCATIQSAAMAGLGAPSGVAVTSIHERGPTYGLGAVPLDQYSLADGFGDTPSPVTPLLVDPLNPGRSNPIPGPGDSPSLEVGIVGLGIKGLPAHHIKRMGLTSYAKNWAEGQLGSSLQSMPRGIHPFVQFSVFPGGPYRLSRF